MRFTILCLLLCFSCIGFSRDTISLERNPFKRLKTIQSCQDSISYERSNQCQPEIKNGLIDNSKLPLNKTFWFHFSVYLPNDIEEPIALKAINFRGVHAVYWDGIQVGENGVFPKKNIDATLGRYQFYAIIPNKLLKTGRHQLKVKYLQMGYPQYPQSRFIFGKYASFNNLDFQANNLMILMCTVFLTATLFFLIFYFGFGKEISFLFLSIYCLSYVLHSILKPYQDFFAPDFLIPFMSFRLTHLITNLGSIFLIAFLLWEMQFPKKLSFLGLFSLISIALFFLIPENQYLFVLVFACTLIVAYGTYQKIEGIGWAITGLFGFISLLILWRTNIFGYGYFMGIIFFLMCMTMLVGQKIARQIQLKQAAQLRSAVLENQLLKKSIQPHFILNSLTSLQELIDMAPQKASDFVEQLANEFKLTSQASSKKLIPLNDELEMCRTHLNIMEYRRNAHFEFITEGLSGEEQIPPGIFHTLIENGITHGYGDQIKGHFLLKKEQQGQKIKYTFFNDSKVNNENPHLNKGTGLKYIEARLKEAYGNKWKMESGAVEGGWQVTILID